LSALLDDIQIHDLPENLQKVAEVIGISNIKALIVKLPGIKVYIPKSISSSYNSKYINEHFTGDNYEAIADHLGLTIRSVRRAIKSRPALNPVI